VLSDLILQHIATVLGGYRGAIEIALVDLEKKNTRPQIEYQSIPIRYPQKSKIKNQKSSLYQSSPSFPTTVIPPFFFEFFLFPPMAHPHTPLD
jgi:hypothetical protein